MTSSITTIAQHPDAGDTTKADGTSASGQRSPQIIDQKGLQRPIGLQSVLLSHSNLLRLAKFYWGPMLKSMLVADPVRRAWQTPFPLLSAR